MKKLIFRGKKNVLEECTKWHALNTWTLWHLQRANWNVNFQVYLCNWMEIRELHNDYTRSILMYESMFDIFDVSIDKKWEDAFNLLNM